MDALVGEDHRRRQRDAHLGGHPGHGGLGHLRGIDDDWQVDRSAVEARKRSDDRTGRGRAVEPPTRLPGDDDRLAVPKDDSRLASLDVHRPGDGGKRFSSVSSS